MNDPTRREERQEKRLVKRLGGKRRRRLLKRSLEENPEDAPHHVADFGRLSSAPWNGRDGHGERDRPRAGREGEGPAVSDDPSN